MSGMAETEPDRRAGPGRRDEDLAIVEHFDRFDREGFEITKAGILEALSVTKSSVEILAGSIDKLASKEELEDVRVETTNRIRKIWPVLAGLVVALAVGLVFFLQLLSIASTNRANGEILVECTTPSPGPDDRHECFEEAQLARGAFAGTLAEIRIRLDAIEAQLEENR